jgi:prophage regulatory protein
MQTQSDNQPNIGKTSPHLPTVFLSDIQIGNRYDVTRQTVWRWSATDPTFPKPIKLTAGCTRWKLSEIEAWESGKAGG